MYKAETFRCKAIARTSHDPLRKFFDDATRGILQLLRYHLANANRQCTDLKGDHSLKFLNGYGIFRNITGYIFWKVL